MNSFEEVLEYALKEVPGCSEAYEVVHTSIIYKKSKTYRFEVLRAIQLSDKSYSVRAYFTEDGTWKAWTSFPWTGRDTPEGALGQAISFFREYSV